LGYVNKFLNFCVLPLLVFKYGHYTAISHSHFLHVTVVSILVFQTFDRMTFGELSFPGTRCYVVTVRHSQTIHDQKKFGNYCA